MYIHERKNWPDLNWDRIKLGPLLAEVRHQQGKLLGRMEAHGFKLREEALLKTLTQDVLKTSEIEGEKLDVEMVRSSIAKRLGIEVAGPKQIHQNIEGIVEVMIDATRGYDKALSQNRLFGWHAALFPTGRSGMHTITVGKWRNKDSGPMQVVSGAHGKEKIHFEAPSYDRLEHEMAVFFRWFNEANETDLVLKSALSHFWFVTIHPFDDGNGRIARAIADMMLARSEQSSQRFYSMSSQIQRERKEYYEVLETCQKSSTDITIWIEWYLNCLKRAIAASESILESVTTKFLFWKEKSDEVLNERQKKILNLLLDGFDGKLTSSKWAKIAKCSQDTAGRDINDLLKRKILLKDNAGGRSTNYTVNLIK